MSTVFSSLPFARALPGTRKVSVTSEGGPPDPLKNVLPGSWVLADEDALKRAANEPEDAELRELNDCLELLSEVFPDIQVEVLREMLFNLSRESRVEVVTDHLLKDKGKWVKGRYRLTSKDHKSDRKTAANKSRRHTNQEIPKEQRFRSATYRAAVKDVLYKEFKGLSHAAIKAVLAEHNYSYTESRPALQQLSSKSWRYYFSNLWTKQPPAGMSDTSSHPLITYRTPVPGLPPPVPYLRQTPSSELNNELYQVLVAPRIATALAGYRATDAILATELSKEEATQAEALFDCECCYNSFIFEQVTSCDSGEHLICQTCVCATMKEALFGQGWTKTVDVGRSALRCMAPCSDEAGCLILSENVKQALLASNEDEKLWSTFEGRITDRTLDTSGLLVQRCPFCSYAEFKEPLPFQLKDLFTMTLSFAKHCGFTRVPRFGSTSFWLLIQPLVVMYAVLWITLQVLQSLFPSNIAASLERVVLRRRGFRFDCQSDKCSIKSCSVCLVKWTDPHICYETTTNSLRHAIEAATTAVVKRTCPRCNTSFVKSTGCNKLVCPCGYAMCYICRAAIGSEGYAHFCQHFREQAGRCRECNRCDLYAVEDEEAIVRQAAHQAEADWRQKEGMPAVTGVDVHGKKRSRAMDRLGNITEEVLRGSGQTPLWTWEGALDALLETVLA
ncbi:hypothetical protein ANO11243_082690 [Dothideomycetidae sp. 11243]|nr:hypothetical protein ANO11243_082690 [fungal sp. No.11243]